MYGRRVEEEFSPITDHDLHRDAAEAPRTIAQLMAKLKKMRLDLFLVEQGFFASREQAQRAVMAGEVTIGDQVIRKSSVMVQPGTAVSLQARSPYVSRGGTKLDGALDHFE